MTPAKPKTKPVKEPKTAQPGIEELTYEQALAELEKIVASLEANRPSEAGQPGPLDTSIEAGKLSLDDAMALFERGQALTRHCINLLDKAELRVRQLTGETLEDLTADI